ncbi:PAS domain-containing protein [Sneathiella chinensis]|uniref:PAS domain-containing protein n=1 Tax=Sneathiella chinensis TaxID=349750 RepID=A0ABQ5U752_9PROT|nr:PAS domain-containing protein [Sneathiella chinensis]GLQ07739.1 hypothetical protein GCM10007924_29600 [Sneathiella chinensis]
MPSFRYYTGSCPDNDPIKAILPDQRDLKVQALSYCTLDPDQTREEDFDIPEHRILWTYWQGLRGDGTIARYSQINPEDFIKAIGNVLLLEPNENGTDFRYRVYGSNVAKLVGREMTGKWISEFGEVPGRLSLAQYPAVMKLKTPLYSEHTASYSASQSTRWCRLLLPMENRDGVLDRILVGTVPKDFATIL